MWNIHKELLNNSNEVYATANRLWNPPRFLLNANENTRKCLLVPPGVTLLFATRSI